MITEKEKVFRFKQFSVGHDRCSMKVGTDAVLLGSWANINNAKRILDIGTGCGVIALMLAQRTTEEVTIDAVEIEQEDARQATENVSQSPWAKKVSVHQKAIQEFHSKRQYDLIVSNPPFFIDSLLPPSRQRAHARHTKRLSYEELILHSIRLLNPNGKLAVIFPVEEGNRFKSIANKKGLHVIRQLAFHSRKDKPQERWLMEFSFEEQHVKSELLTLYNSNHEWSDGYRKLTSEFYLNS